MEDNIDGYIIHREDTKEKNHGKTTSKPHVASRRLKEIEGRGRTTQPRPRTLQNAKGGKGENGHLHHMIHHAFIYFTDESLITAFPGRAPVRYLGAWHSAGAGWRQNLVRADGGDRGPYRGKGVSVALGFLRCLLLRDDEEFVFTINTHQGAVAFSLNKFVLDPTELEIDLCSLPSVVVLKSEALIKLNIYILAQLGRRPLSTLTTPGRCSFTCLRLTRIATKLLMM